MRRNHAICVVGAALLAAAGSVSAAAVLGPPMICHAIDIGQARSLPCADGGEPRRDYPRSQAVADALAMLNADRPVLERMETIRRAVVYTATDAAASERLVGSLASRALDAELDAETASESGRAAAGLAWFDAGYAVACRSQLHHSSEELARPGEAEGAAGYAWIRRALSYSPDNAEMSFGAALATHPGMLQSRRDLFEGHVRDAARGAEPGSLLMKNLQAHLANWGESLDDIVAGR